MVDSDRLQCGHRIGHAAPGLVTGGLDLGSELGALLRADPLRIVSYFGEYGVQFVHLESHLLCVRLEPLDGARKCVELPFQGLGELLEQVVGRDPDRHLGREVGTAAGQQSLLESQTA